VKLDACAISVRRIIAVGRLCQLVYCVTVVQYYVQICFGVCCVTNGRYENRLYVPLIQQFPVLSKTDIYYEEYE